MPKLTQVSVTRTLTTTFAVQVPDGMDEDAIQDLVYDQGLEKVLALVGQCGSVETTDDDGEVDYVGWGRIVGQDGNLSAGFTQAVDLVGLTVVTP